MRAPTPTAAAELAVPVLADLNAALADFGRRARNCFDKGISDRKRHLVQLARVLPKPEQLFAVRSQRLDRASERLGQGLSRNLQIHRARLVKAAALVRERPIVTRILHARERLANLGARALRCEQGQLAKERERLQSLSRVLDSISYKAVLERGFALVRNADGKIRRRAADIKAGEGLSLVFADGEKTAHADGLGGGAGKAKKTGTDQGNLF
jgi:exodeoxyribonuclease VII large subunit